MDNWTGDNDSKSIRVLIQIGGRIQGFHHQNRRFDLEKTKGILCATEELVLRVEYHARFNKHEALVLLQQLSVHNIRGAVTTMRDTEHRWRLMSGNIGEGVYYGDQYTFANQYNPRVVNSKSKGDDCKL